MEYESWEEGGVGSDGTAVVVRRKEEQQQQLSSLPYPHDTTFLSDLLTSFIT